MNTEIFNVLSECKLSILKEAVRERDIAHVVAQVWANHDIPVLQEVRLLLPSKTKRSGTARVWLGGQFYTIIIADFLIDHVAIELKVNSNGFLDSHSYGQCLNYLKVSGIEQVYLLVFNREICEFRVVDPLLKHDNMVIKLKGQSDHGEHYGRLEDMLNYCDRRADELYGRPVGLTAKVRHQAYR